jgi:pyruvate/2-oxoglutarate/acetoin dehydrogenase E1 component
MARNITYREAINEALTQEMERDESVIVLGEDNAGGAGAPGEDDAWGGVLGVTKGLYHKFPGRVLDTPISESAFIGAAIGAATGRLVVVDEAHPRCSIATDISALVAQKAFGALRAPIEMVTAPHTPVPFSTALEDIFIPDAQRVVNAVKAVTGWTR